MSRRRAREIVLQVLYQKDLNPDVSIEQNDEFVRARLGRNEKLSQFAFSLIRGVTIHAEAIDKQLMKTADNWRLGRMAATDRAILRLGTFEILFSDTPNRVAINESIELAKRYGSDQSAQFVNGVLDRLMKDSLSEGDEAKIDSPADDSSGDEAESIPRATKAPTPLDFRRVAPSPNDCGNSE